MGVLDQITSKLGGQDGQEGGLASIQHFVSSNGGLQGMTEKLSNSGMAKQVQSWIGSGENEPISGQQVQRAVDPNELHSMARNAGMSDEEASEQLARAMPEMVNEATPQGQIPPQDPFAKGLDSIKRMLKI
jgi:uncharacterized protein YidB (DUF937 family)